jgi:hypothetical protein
MTEPTCLFCKSALSVPSDFVPAELCNTCAQELAARVLDACVTSWISTDGKTPVELLRALQMWEQQIALDPAVSEAAKLLVEQRDAAREENTNLRETIEGVSRSLAATVNGWDYDHNPVLGVSQALKLACDTIEDLRAGRYAPIAGRGVSRSAYDEALDAIVAGDKRLEAAEKMVSQMLGALADIADSEDEHGVPSSREWMEKRAKEAFSLSAPVDGRWCPASERDAAIRDRDEALAILRDLVTLQDSPSDRYKIDESTQSVEVEIGDITRLKIVQYVAAIDRARKLLGGES